MMQAVWKLKNLYLNEIYVRIIFYLGKNAKFMDNLKSTKNPIEMMAEKIETNMSNTSNAAADSNSASTLSFNEQLKKFSDADLDKSIREYDEWFRYAETIGQQRLYNFFMAASILLLACATILASEKSPICLSLGLSVCGFILSLLWTISGYRQVKFHEILEDKIDSLLEKHPLPFKFPIASIRNLKRGIDSSIKLSFIEKFFSTRVFLWLVPVVFMAGFFLTIILSFLKACLP